jgi:hypothetical protein
MAAHVARIVLAAQLAAQLVAGVGHAAPPPGPPPARADPAEARALDHLDRGVAAYRAGDFARARTELVAASELAPDRPNPYRWLALAEVALGDCAGALVHIESFLSHVAAGDPRVAEIVAVRERCLDAALVTVTSRPSGAAIRLDGGPPIATTPARRLAMRGGPHHLVLELPGYLTATHDFEAVTRGELVSDIALVRAPAAAPLVRRWWFWAAVGAVAVTAAGVTYGLTRDAGSRLPSVTCDPQGCRP